MESDDSEFAYSISIVEGLAETHSGFTVKTGSREVGCAGGCLIQAAEPFRLRITIAGNQVRFDYKPGLGNWETLAMSQAYFEEEQGLMLQPGLFTTILGQDEVTAQLTRVTIERCTGG